MVNFFFTENKIGLFRMSSFRIKAVLISFLFMGHGLFAEEETDNSLSITSKTKNVSAQCTISGGNKDEDKKRTDIGVGEIVALELTGKRVKDISSVTWKVATGEEWAKVKAESEKSTTATLTAQKEPKTAGPVSVEAKATLKNGEEITKTMNFQVLVPTDITAMHSGLRAESNREGNPPWFPRDAHKEDLDIPGASSLLVLIVQPLTVNFENIQILERAKDKPGDVAGWCGAHNAGFSPTAPDPRHEMRHDTIGAAGLDQSLPEYQKIPDGGQQAQWKCGWYTYDKKECCLISGKYYLQIFSRSREAKSPGSAYWNIRYTISKFGQKVTRSTADGKHVDSTEAVHTCPADNES